MPPVSEAQRKAMYAAREGRSTLGIPKAIGEEFVGKDAGGHAAGILFVAPDGDVLLLRRSGAETNYAHHWALPGGKAEDGETPEQCAEREVAEEMGSSPAGTRKLLDRQQTPNGMTFSTFAQPVEDKFAPKLNSEHSGYAWAPLNQLPQPLHPAVAKTLQERLGTAQDMSPEEWEGLRSGFAKWTREEEAEVEHAQDALAFDKASVRTYDKDGRLHVEMTPISKANVCGYKGSEIPDFQTLGLDPDRIYNLYRDPDELAKAAASFNNLPVLSRHVPVDANNHQPGLVVGSTGTDAEFAAPYLKNSLVIWARDAIDGVEDESARELSCAYRYRADMSPGTVNGESYDGVMRDIVGNHIAVVSDGRAGPDVVVGDSAIQMEKSNMATKPILTRKASVAHGAIIAYLRPKLAQDAKIDLTPVLAKVTGKNFKDSKPAIIEGIKKGVAGKLAQDADIGDLVKLLDGLEGMDPAEGVDTDPNSGLPMAALPEKKPDAVDATPYETIKSLIAQLSDVERGELAEMLASGASDEEECDKSKSGAMPFKKAEDEEKDKDKDKDMVTKPAMDAAIAAAAKAATDAAVKTQREIRDAERAVRSRVGELAMAHDSAEGVYRSALKILGVPNAETIHHSALPALLEMQPIPGARSHNPPAQIAQDAASIDSFTKRFPGAARIGNV